MNTEKVKNKGQFKTGECPHRCQSWTGVRQEGNDAINKNIK